MACRSKDFMSPLTSIGYIYICNYTDYTYICSQQNIIKHWEFLASIYPSLSNQTCFSFVWFKLPFFSRLHELPHGSMDFGIQRFSHHQVNTFWEPSNPWLRSPKSAAPARRPPLRSMSHELQSESRGSHTRNVKTRFCGAT